MTRTQGHLAAALSILAVVSAAAPGWAQQPSGKVLLPWQKPQPRPAPDMREILPWLMGEEAVGKPASGDAAAWAAQLDDPVVPLEPIVAEPVLAGPRLETGAIVPSGLVLKKPVPAVHAVAAQTAATKPDPAPGPTVEKAVAAAAASTATGEVAAATGDRKAAADSTVAETSATADGAVPAASDTAGDVDKPEPATGAGPEDASAPAKAVEAAPSMPDAEEVPGIPEPLPDALVTPVRAPEAEKTEIPASAARAAATAAPERLRSVKPNPPKRLADGANAAQQYCFNIADAAKDARYAWQKKTLADVEAELKKRIALLDERTAEYQKWLARRDEFIRTAEDGVVKIYSGMKPDTAGSHLALMNEETAAAVLVKLNTRNASAILNEMEPSKAARLTSIITGAAKLKRRKQVEREAAAAAAAAAGEAPSDTPVPVTAPDGGRS